MKRFSLLLLLPSLVTFMSAADNPSALERFAPPADALVSAENGYWKRVSLPIPDGIVLEASGILAQPGKRLLVTTRRGEIWWVDGAYDENPKPRFTLFASGLHEPLGIIADPKGGYYVAQREEITHLLDSDGDGRADVFTTVWKIPVYGNYHEYAYGPVLAPNGNLRVLLNVSFGAPTQSTVPWRGWMVEVTPDGHMTPIAAGFRSPNGFTVSSGGDWFYAENQGEWVASGRVGQIEPGDFFGHPASLAWSDLTGSPVKLKRSDIPDSGEPLFEVAKRVPGLKPPAVWLPHTIMGISSSEIREDVTAGKFGPYAGQYFVGDQGQSKISRVSMEKVKGVWQGACYAFRSGFECGIIRLTWGEDGSLFAGETNRGWGSIGPKEYGLERLVWTGQVPFDLKEVRAEPDGFLLTFTQPVDPKIAGNPASYSVAGFTYKYHSIYGSAPINRLSCPLLKVSVAADGLSVRLASGCLREGYIHEIKVAGVRSASGSVAPLHDTAYYTLNRFPDGDRIAPKENPELCVAQVPAAANAPTAKHPTTYPKSWPNWEEDQTILISTAAGLKFDRTLITVKAGTRVRVVVRNQDEMLHNWVLCAPGRGTAVGESAMALGLDGMARNYVPETPDVLFHTALLQPDSSDSIFFQVPEKTGDYDFICSFPGHYMAMRGILRVEAK
jgi:azurin/glucose/arabinose dehydrogenase